MSDSIRAVAPPGDQRSGLSEAFTARECARELDALACHFLQGTDSLLRNAARMLRAFNAEVEQLRRASDWRRQTAAEALAWYRDEAEALARHMQGGAHTQAVLASVTVLSLDGGGRARAALARGIGAEGQDAQRLGAEPAEPGPEGAPKTFQNRSEDAPPSEP